MTPPLGQSGYVFPVAGTSAYGDTYGAFRGDVRGKWHHGTDIFAPLGTPVLAVASGTVNRVGWRRAGGWRVWVRDAAANEFYYAHLSGYARPIFHSRYVRAGQVIGFVGNTGDAFPGPPHLHFEIHPHQLLRLHYDGAVNPSSYVGGWNRLQSVHSPRPKHPALTMRAAKRRQAEVVFGQLLVVRDLVSSPRRSAARTPVDASPERARRVADVQVASSPMTTPGDAQPSPLVEPLVGGLAALALFGALALAAYLARRLRTR